MICLAQAGDKRNPEGATRLRQRQSGSAFEAQPDTRASGVALCRCYWNLRPQDGRGAATQDGALWAFLGVSLHGRGVRRLECWSSSTAALCFGVTPASACPADTGVTRKRGVALSHLTGATQLPRGVLLVRGGILRRLARPIPVCRVPKKRQGDDVGGVLASGRIAYPLLATRLGPAQVEHVKSGRLADNPGSLRGVGAFLEQHCVVDLWLWRLDSDLLKDRHQVLRECL
jgi:hypothetical protein